MQKNVAPRDKPKIAKKDPYHLPKIKPENKIIGEPKPNKKIQIKIKSKENKLLKNKLVFFRSIKYLLLSLIKL